MLEVKFRIDACTNMGLVRENNEDLFIVNPDLEEGNWSVPSPPDTLSLGKYGALMVVADGMGGMNAGEVASSIAVETVKQSFSTQNLKSIVNDDKRIRSFMSKTVVLADRNIKKRAGCDPASSGMGTTIVMVWIISNKAIVCWCGDSRAYLFNDSLGLVRLSKDHSYVQQLVDEGKLDEECAFDHPYSNIITRSLGDSSSIAKPETCEMYLSEGDIILVCTDGLCGLCRDGQISDILFDNYNDLQSCRDNLLDAALQNGGYDNVTLTLFKVVEIEGGQRMHSTAVDRRPTIFSKLKKVFSKKYS